MDADVLPYASALVLAYEGATPVFGPDARLGAGAAVLGQATLGARAVIAAGAVVRADGHHVTAGDDFSIGQGSTVHISHGLMPTEIGDRVTVGAGAVIHACTLGDGCVVEDGAVVLDAAMVGPGVLVEAGATVFSRARLEDAGVYSGSPAQRLRDLAPGELAARAKALRQAAADTLAQPGPSPSARAASSVFVAANARLAGEVRLAEEASVFFGCDLDAGEGTISIGAKSNIQDNSTIRCGKAGAAVGRDSTLGHNVDMADGRVGDGCLVGIGSKLGPGTVIEDDVFLAAGSTTSPGQVLTSGHLWGGRPARIIAPLDERKRLMMRFIVEQYCRYARSYRD